MPPAVTRSRTTQIVLMLTAIGAVGALGILAGIATRDRGEPVGPRGRDAVTTAIAPRTVDPPETPLRSLAVPTTSEVAAEDPRQPTAATSPSLCLVVNVSDQDTGHPLEAVDVVWSPGQPLPWWHPGNGSELVFLARATRSPVTVPLVSGGLARGDDPTTILRHQQLWVGSPGYSWIPIDAVTGEEHLRLDRAGSLDVSIGGGQVPAGARLNLRFVDPRPAGTSHLEWRTRHLAKYDVKFASFTPATSGVTHLDRLPQGKWSMTLDVGRSASHVLHLAEAEIEIRAGTTGTVTLMLDELAVPPPTILVAGTLRFPEAWGTRSRMHFEPCGMAKAWSSDVSLAIGDLPRNDTGEFHWNVGRIHAGTYRVSIHPCGYHTTLQVGPRDEIAHRIDVPPPCDVVVRFVDVESLAPLRFEDDETLPTWSSQGGHSSQSMDKRADGALTFRAPPGPVCIDSPQGYAWLEGTHEVRPGANEFTVGVRRECGVEVVLKDGEERWPYCTGDLLRKDGSSATFVQFHPDCRMLAREAGDYTLSIRPEEGFEAIPARKVTVKPGEWTTVEIPLRRKP